MNILILCTYPINNPKHGGQLRVRHIVDCYRAAEYNVQVVGVLGSEHYESEDGFLSFPRFNDLSNIVANPFLIEDYAIGMLYNTNDSHYRHLSKLISINPDVIQIEQPWLFAFALRYKNEHKLNAKIIYSSQNIEWQLKKDILSSYVDESTANNGANFVNDLELLAIQNSDAIICVSENDRNWIKSSTKCPILLAPNGVKSWHTSELSHQETSIYTKNYAAYALYCASAHPPNMTGFFDMLSGGFGSLKPDEALIIAGGAGSAIANDNRVHQSPKLAEKIIITGIINQRCLEGLLDQAHCIILPLTQGGGTNLKTAEALWAGKHIIATSIAMRGFEQFIDSPGVKVANDPITFKRMLREAMNLPPLELTAKDIDERRIVLWENCLKPLPQFISSIANRVNS